ncbi:MAG: DUF1015 domain-containing protein [Balneolaceae bacterium]|nr:DUF1015 domain-containing protein [Balneolaceae bacterium]
MAVLRPFKVWRPTPEFVQEIISVPYDVIETDEARKQADGNDFSFLRVVRPEINLLESTSIYDDAVYQSGAETLEKFLASDRFIQDEEPSIYIYQLAWDGQTKTGLFGCVSVDDYDSDVILKHENTRPDKEDDRTKHLVTQKAHAEPVMMTFRTTEALQKLTDQVTETKPLYEVEDDHSVIHRIWRMDSESSQNASKLFEHIPNIYIADGHHRCASASRAAKEVDLENYPEAAFFPAVLFPIEEVRILAYNRIIYQLPDSFLSDLNASFDLQPTQNPVPTQPGTVCFYVDGGWYSMDLPTSKASDVASQLDVARLQEFILEPMLGITDQRTDKNISFVGGIHGTSQLEKLVDGKSAEMAISMYPTSIHELVDVSDAGQLMPPKSTWFEPKLKSGFLIHTF